MKVTKLGQKKVEIKEMDITDSLVDLETGEEIDLNELVKEHFNNGDCVKVQIVRVVKEEE